MARIVTGHRAAAPTAGAARRLEPLTRHVTLAFVVAVASGSALDPTAPARAESAVSYTSEDTRRQPPEPTKSGEEREPWEIDRARILHSAAFRRLQRKTQVFASHEGDSFRTRLTHSLEVSQIAKGIALRVGANPTLCEAAGLAHDIGHPPFGHSGEAVLHDCMRSHGGFESNAQNLRVLTSIEVKSELYRGLNLCRGTLDALLKYKHSYSEARERGAEKFFYDDDLELVEWVCQGQRTDERSFECQIMDWADDIAYSVHDLEDGMQAGLVSLPRLKRARTLEAILAQVPEATVSNVEGIIQEFAPLLTVGGERHRKAARKTWTSNVIHQMVQASSSGAASTPPALGGSARYAVGLHVDESLRLRCHILKAVAMELVFRDQRVSAVIPRARRVIGTLFEALLEERNFNLYPEDYRERLAESGEDRLRIACDFISGMTDDYAERIYRRLTRKAS